MNKLIKLSSIIAFSLTMVSCNQNNTSNSDISDSVYSEVNVSSVGNSSFASSNSSEQISSVVDDTKYTTFVDLKDVTIEIGESYSLKHALFDYKGVTITSKDSNIAYYNTNTLQIVGSEVGQTALILNYKGQSQLLNVTVKEQGTFSTNFAFDRFHLEDKNLVAFGDSVTADATLGGAGQTYVSLFAKEFRMKLLRNYAIGGTTATYMYPGSNIYKEYASNTTAIDGPRVVRRAFENGELDTVDYAFIAYGHNDQYFQPPITVPGDDVFSVDNRFTTCHSYKGSYRYMINLLREVNPMIRIIILNCTYSEYDKNLKSPYGSTYNYTSYRNATKEIAEEMNCRYIDPWDYMKNYFDFQKGNVYYKDSVHLSPKGHQVLSDFIFKN